MGDPAVTPRTRHPVQIAAVATGVVLLLVGILVPAVGMIGLGVLLGRNATARAARWVPPGAVLLPITIATSTRARTS